MKTNNFKLSMLAVGVVASLGMTGTAFAIGGTAGTTPVTGVTSAPSNSTFAISNKATATYNVGTQAQPKVTSNTVTVNVSQQIQFNLAENRTGTVMPDGKVVFSHTLTNEGNTDDEYTINVGNVTSGDNFDYSSFEIEVTIPGAAPKIISNGDKVTLKPSEKATIKITATASDNNKPADEGKLTVSATSTLYPAGTDKTLTNTDTATTTTPVFAIAKSVSTTQVQKGDKFTYTIKVKNTGNLNATNTTISDTLPAGLEFNTPANITVKRGSSDISSSVAVNTTANKLTITGVDIAQSTASSTAEDITVTFDVVVPTTATQTSFDNKASVTDTTTGKTITDTTDTGETVPSGNGQDNDDSNPSTVTVVNSSVNLTPSREVTLPITGETVFEHTLHNNGTANIAANTLTLEQDITQNSNNITQEFYIDSNGNGTFDPSTDTAYTPGTPLNVTLAPNADVKIFVKNTATDADAGTNNKRIKREVYKLKLTSTSVSSLPPAITDTVYIAGLELKKEQAVAACGTAIGTLTYQTDAISNAKPGQCIFYKITAINHLPSGNPTNLRNFTNVDVSDTIANLGTGVGKVTYNADLNGNGMTTSYNQPVVSGNAATLAAGGEANLTFSVTINQ